MLEDFAFSHNRHTQK